MYSSAHSSEKRIGWPKFFHEISFPCGARIAPINRIVESDLLQMKRGLFLWRKQMTKLPEKDLSAGNKIPKTTTGEMKDALGKLRDY